MLLGAWWPGEATECTPPGCPDNSRAPEAADAPGAVGRLLDLEAEIGHQAGGRGRAVGGAQSLGQEVHGVQRAQAQPGPIPEPEIPYSTDRELGDRIDRSWLASQPQELIVLHPLRAQEERPRRSRSECAFQGQRVEPALIARAPAPGHRRGPPPACAAGAGVDGARGPFPLGHPGLELLRVLLFRPGQLQRPFLRGVPGEPCRRGIQRTCLNVVAVLVWLAAPKPRRFQLPAIMHVAERRDAISDVRGIEPVMAYRRL